VSYPTLFVFEAAWVIVLVVSIRWLRDHPWRSAIVPLVGVVLAWVDAGGIGSTGYGSRVGRTTDS